MVYATNRLPGLDTAS
jgi:hypothetical protein